MHLSEQQADALRDVVYAVNDLWDKASDAEQLLPGHEIDTSSIELWELASLDEIPTKDDLIRVFRLAK